MNIKSLVLFWFLLSFLAPLPILADEDLRALVKVMSARLNELDDQVVQSNKRIAELEEKLAETERKSVAIVNSNQELVKATPAVTIGDAKGTFKIPGSETSLGFGGQIKLDANYSNVSAGRDKLGDQLLVVPQIPVGTERFGLNDRTIFNAKDSRFWLKSYTPSTWGDIDTFVEMDFYGSPEINNYSPRLRHAYGSIGNFLAGQTWTTFLNVSALPDTLDAGGPVGALNGLRQPLIRWTQPFASGRADFQVAAESPRSRLWADSVAGAGASDGNGFNYPNGERYPDIVARINYNPQWGTLSVTGMAREIRYVKPNTRDEQKDWGGAVSLAGRINFSGLDNIRFMFNYGNAIGRYATGNAFQDAALDANGQLHLVNIYGGELAYQHWWNKTLRSTLAYGYVEADQPSFILGDRTQDAESVHANLLWSPVLQATFGVEYIYAHRQRIDNQSDDLHRLQFSTRYVF